MKRLALVLVFVLLATPAFAESWIQCITTTVGTVTYDKPVKRQGDCTSLGLCTGPNNAGLLPNVFEAQGTEWADASQADQKCDQGQAVGSRIVSLTAQEISDIADFLNTQNETSVRNGAKAYLNDFEDVDLILRAIVELTVQELNILRKAHNGQIYIFNGTTSSDLTSQTWTVVDQFNTTRGFDGVSSGDIIVDKVNNRIIVNQTGEYLVNYHISFTGANGAEIGFAIGVNGSFANNTVSGRLLGNNDLGNVSGIGLLSLTSGDIIELMAFNNEAQLKNYSIEHAQLNVVDIDNKPARTRTQVINAIKSEIDSGNVDTP